MKCLSIAGLLISCSVFAQTPSPDKPVPRTIEVKGSAETSVTPNEFIFAITIKERFEKKEKITLELQEKHLKESLTGIGIDSAKDLSIADLTTRFGYVPGRKQKDVLGSRNYRLKVRDLAKIDKLQEIAEDLDLARLDLVESKYTDMATLRREAKTAAVRAAKEKATYLLQAIGEHIGKTILIQEAKEEEVHTLDRPNRVSPLAANYSGAMMSRMSAEPEVGEPLPFAPIMVRYEVLAKFEIE